METIVIQPKNKDEADFLTNLLLKLNFTIRETSGNIIEFVSSSENKEVAESNNKKSSQKEMLKTDLKESFSEIEKMNRGKKEKKSLEQFLNEF
jgi:septal ring factor EnvC (AmiA/AmiB activator)